MRLALVLAVLLAALVFGHTPAAGAPEHRLAQETNAWLEGLGLPVGSPELHFGELPDVDNAARETADGAALGTAVPGAVVFVASFERDYRELARGRALFVDLGAVVAILHEPLHHIRLDEWHARDAASRSLEEGAVEAVARDLVAPWTRRFLGEAIAHDGPGAYQAQVRWIRKLSAAACGCPWPSYGARSWRRALLLADDPTRTAMVEETARAIA